MKLFLLLVLSLTLPACGKFKEKFGRLEDGYTRVYLQGEQNPYAVSLVGGVMVYFIDNGNPNLGHAFAFASESDANSRSVVVPNGNYKVYTLGFLGTPNIENQGYCGFGDGGAVVNLSGSAKSVSIAMSTGNCNFGNAAAPFTTALGSDYSDNDKIELFLCSDNAYPGCTAATGNTYYVKMSLLGGIKHSSGAFTPNAQSLYSSCSSSITGSLLTNFRVPIGGTLFSPPVGLQFYSDSLCNTAVPGGTFTFVEGLKYYSSVASGASIYLNSATSVNYTTLKIYKSF